jgi:trehalose synthase
MSPPERPQPFRFCSSLDLTLLTNRRARDLAELLAHDVSAPQLDAWDFLAGYVARYDACVFFPPQFSRDLDLPQVMITPSIDPLSDKNRELTESEIDQVLERLKMPRDKPIITQVSRFDRLKDPLGVIAASRLAHQYNECRLPRALQ